MLGVDRISLGGIGSVSVGPGSIALVRWKVVPRVGCHNINASPYVKLRWFGGSWFLFNGGLGNW